MNLVTLFYQKLENKLHHFSTIDIIHATSDPQSRSKNMSITPLQTTIIDPQSLCGTMTITVAESLDDPCNFLLLFNQFFTEDIDIDDGYLARIVLTEPCQTFIQSGIVTYKIFCAWSLWRNKSGSPWGLRLTSQEHNIVTQNFRGCFVQYAFTKKNIGIYRDINNNINVQTKDRYMSELVVTLKGTGKVNPCDFDNQVLRFSHGGKTLPIKLIHHETQTDKTHFSTTRLTFESISCIS